MGFEFSFFGKKDRKIVYKNVEYMRGRRAELASRKEENSLETLFTDENEAKALEIQKKQLKRWIFLEELTYEPFISCRELLRIRWGGPKQENESLKMRRVRKREMIQKFRENLNQYRQGIAKLIQEIWEEIHTREVTEEMLMARVRNAAPAIQLCGADGHDFADAIESLVDKQGDVKRMWQLYREDPHGLFRKCFGQDPKGKIEVEYGPITVHFRLFDAEDYALAYGYGSTKDRQKKIQELTAHGSVGGAALSVVGSGFLEDAVTIENASYAGWEPSHSQAIKDHEEQHQFNKYFKPYEAERTEEDVFAEAMERSERGMERKAILEQVVLGLSRLERKTLDMDERARDEFLSYYRDGSSPQKIYETLSENALYDFVGLSDKQLREMAQKLKEVIEKNLTENEKPLRVSRGDIEKILKKVLFKDYDRDLRQWELALNILQIKGYNREEIVELLYQEPVSHWNALAKNMAYKDEKAA